MRWNITPTTIHDAPAIPEPDPVRPDLKFVEPRPALMSWNSPVKARQRSL